MLELFADTRGVGGAAATSSTPRGGGGMAWIPFVGSKELVFKPLSKSRARRVHSDREHF